MINDKPVSPSRPSLIAPGVLQAQNQATKEQSTQTKPVPSALSTPDQLRQWMGKTGNSSPQVPIPSINQATEQLTKQLQNGEQQLLANYQASVMRDAQGQVMGYQIKGQSVTKEQFQQYLLPVSTFLHQDLEKTKAQVSLEFQQLKSAIDRQLPQMNAAEQQSLNIQLKAIGTLFTRFMTRIQAIDELIR